MLQALWAELQKRQAYDRSAITYSGGLGPCDGGPNLLVFPENVLYRGVAATDVAELFDTHFEGGKVVERLRADAAVW